MSQSKIMDFVFYIPVVYYSEIPCRLDLLFTTTDICDVGITSKKAGRPTEVGSDSGASVLHPNRLPDVHGQ